MKNLIFSIRSLSDRVLIGCKKLIFSSSAALCCILFFLSFSGYSYTVEEYQGDTPSGSPCYRYVFTGPYSIHSTLRFNIWESAWNNMIANNYSSWTGYPNVTSFYLQNWEGGTITVKECPDASCCNKITCATCGESYCSVHGGHTCGSGSGSGSGSGTGSGDSGSGSGSDSGSGSGSDSETSAVDSSVKELNEVVQRLLSKVSTEAKQDSLINGLSNWSSVWNIRSNDILNQLFNNQETIGTGFETLAQHQSNITTKLSDSNSKLDDLKEGQSDSNSKLDDIKGINDDIRTGVTNADNSVKELKGVVQPEGLASATVKQKLEGSQITTTSSSLTSIKNKLLPSLSSGSGSGWPTISITIPLGAFGMSDFPISITSTEWESYGVLTQIAAFTRSLSVFVFAIMFLRSVVTSLRQW